MDQITNSLENLNIDNNIDIKYINNRIINEICYNTINKLTDDNLLEEYKKTKSVIKKIRSYIRKI